MTTAPTAHLKWLSQVIIRHVRSTDLSALEWGGEYAHFRRIFNEAFEHAREGRSILWVAELQPHELIGQLFVQLFSGRRELADGRERAYIYGFRVKPAYRRAGLGARMLTIAEQDLIRRGYHYVTLNVGQNNPEARRLYEKLGYQVITEDPGRWSYLDHHGERKEVDEPAWRMEKILPKKSE